MSSPKSATLYPGRWMRRENPPSEVKNGWVNYYVVYYGLRVLYEGKDFPMQFPFAGVGGVKFYLVRYFIANGRLSRRIRYRIRGVSFRVINLTLFVTPSGAAHAASVVSRLLRNKPTRLGLKTRLGVRRRWGQFSRSPSRPNPERRNTTYVRVTENASSSPVVSNVVIETYYRDYTSVSTPGFRTKKKKTRLPINPHTVHLVKTDWGNASAQLINTTNPTDWAVVISHCADTPFNGNFAAISPIPANLQNRALRKLIDRAQLGIEGNIAQDFAQFDQTTRLIGTTMRRLTGSITALRRGNFSLAVRSLTSGDNAAALLKRLSPSKSLARNWLELQYGWKPLLQDCQGVMQSLASYLIKDRDTVRSVRGSAMVGEEVHRTFPTTWTSDGYGHEYSTTAHTFKYGLRYKIDFPSISFLQQLGFTNPLNLAWEVLPYSFVVDWFLPIGPYLECLTAFHGITFIDGYTVAFSRKNASVKLAANKAPYAGGPPYVVDMAGFATREEVVLARSALSGFPSPRLPTFKSPFSLVHISNGLALLRAGFKR